MTRTDLAWLAGLLEGEGSFSIKHGNSDRPSWKKIPCIRVTMSDEDTIRKVAVLWDRAICDYYPPSSRERGYKRCWTTCIAGKDAVALMKNLLPFMSARRAERIRGLIATYEEYAVSTHCKNGHPRSESHRNKRNVLICRACGREASRRKRRKALNPAE